MDTRGVQQFFSELLDYQVSVGTNDSLGLEAVSTVAHYRLDPISNSLFAALDLEAAANLGASLTRFPVSMAKESIQRHELPENLRVNLYEVFNVASNLFAEARETRVILDNVSYCNNEFDRSQLLRNAEATFSYNLSIPNYGEGRLLLGRFG